MTWLGLDIGGANLKIASSNSKAKSIPFSLWKKPQRLAGHLAQLRNRFSECSNVAITMTGELCDCFQTKTEGILHILSAVETAFPNHRIVVYSNHGEFLSIQQVRDKPLVVAAGNWRALAEFACRFLESPSGVLIDIGSTTTDIVPLFSMGPSPSANQDTDRLIASELVYSGVGRTPLCGFVKTLPWRGKQCPVAAEFFASSRDAYIELGLVPEEPQNCSTADGAPRTKVASRRRLARSICLDSDQLLPAEATAIAKAIFKEQLEKLIAAAETVLKRMSELPKTIIISGEGEFLAKRVAKSIAPQAAVISLTESLGATISRCAPAYALAVLAEEQYVP